MSAILSWRYEGDYALYDLSPDDRSTLMDPGSCYWSIHRAGMLIGYVCVGSEARVAGMTADENFVDVGLGIRPNITGRGASRALLAATLAALEQCLGSDSFRSVVASWNQRAQRAAEHAGFRATGRHENERGSYIVFARSSSLND